MIQCNMHRMRDQARPSQYRNIEYYEKSQPGFFDQKLFLTPLRLPTTDSLLAGLEYSQTEKRIPTMLPVWSTIRI